MLETRSHKSTGASSLSSSPPAKLSPTHYPSHCTALPPLITQISVAGIAHLSACAYKDLPSNTNSSVQIGFLAPYSAICRDVASQTWIGAHFKMNLLDGAILQKTHQHNNSSMVPTVFRMMQQTTATLVHLLDERLCPPIKNLAAPPVWAQGRGFERSVYIVVGTLAGCLQVPQHVLEIHVVSTRWCHAH